MSFPFKVQRLKLWDFENNVGKEPRQVQILLHICVYNPLSIYTNTTLQNKDGSYHLELIIVTQWQKVGNASGNATKSED